MAFAHAQDTNVHGGTFVEVHGDNYNIGNLSIHRQVEPEPGTYATLPGLQILFEATSPGAAFNSHERDPPAKCHPGTRTEVLEQITDWVKMGIANNGRDRVLWLHGPAGAGKSAIAQTIAEDCALNGFLAASFFFSRSHAGRDSIDRVFTTIAYQLALAIPKSRSPLQQILFYDPSVVHQAITTQLQKLIIEPLQASASASEPLPQNLPSSANQTPSLVIIDGLDECAGTANQRQILRHVLTLVSAPNFPLRFLIVSRPEYAIRHAFEGTELSKFSSMAISLYGHNGALEDVHTYLLHEFARIYSSDVHEPWMVDVPKPWPPSATLNVVLARSGGYFIYASTLIKFVDQESASLSPLKRLELALESPSSNPGTFGELDKLYRQVLSTHRDVSVLRIFLRAVFAKVPDKAIAGLFGLEQAQVTITLRGLHSVIRVNPQGIPVPIHASFSDFIFDPTRSEQFHVGPVDADFWAELTRATLGCFTRHCSQASKESQSLFVGAQKHVLTAVYYGYQNWKNYLTNAGPHQDALIKEIKEMDPSCWIPLPHEAEPLPWHDKDLSNLKMMCVHAMRMLLNLPIISEDTPSVPKELRKYFSELRDTVFSRLFEPLYPQDSDVIYVFTSDLRGASLMVHHNEWNGAWSISDKAMAIPRLLNLEHPLPYQTLRIHELLNAFDSFSVSVHSVLRRRDRDVLRDYLTNKDAPPKILINPRIGHAYLAFCCMLLLTADVDAALAGPRHNRSSLEHSYSRLYWAIHVSCAPYGDKTLLHHLRSLDRRCLFNTEYFSGTISYVEELERVGSHVAYIEWIDDSAEDIISCDKCTSREEIVGKEHDKTLVKLSHFVHMVASRDWLGFVPSWPANSASIYRNFLFNDIWNARLVLGWLNNDPHAPGDLIHQWEAHLQELRGSAYRSNQKLEDWDSDWDTSVKVSWFANEERKVNKDDVNETTIRVQEGDIDSRDNDDSSKIGTQKEQKRDPRAWFGKHAKYLAKKMKGTRGSDV